MITSPDEPDRGGRDVLRCALRVVAIQVANVLCKTSCLFERGGCHGNFDAATRLGRAVTDAAHVVRDLVRRASRVLTLRGRGEHGRGERTGDIAVR